MGAIALTWAAVDDVTAWCLLALVVSVVESHTSGALSTVVMALAFIVAMVVVGRPATPTQQPVAVGRRSPEPFFDVARSIRPSTKTTWIPSSECARSFCPAGLH